MVDGIGWGVHVTTREGRVLCRWRVAWLLLLLQLLRWIFLLKGGSFGLVGCEGKCQIGSCLVETNLDFV